MRFGSLRLSFRARLVLFAALLVIAIQLGTLAAVLDSVRDRQEAEASEAVDRAGNAFAVFMQNRIATLTRVANVVVADFPFRQRVGDVLVARSAGNEAEQAEAERGLEDVLRNHAARASSPVAAVFDTDGVYLAGIGAGGGLLTRGASRHFANEAGGLEPLQTVAFIDGQPYHAVSVPFRDPPQAPVPTAWVTLGFPIDAALAREVSELTRLESTFLGFGLGRTDRYATTVEPAWQETAMAGLHLGAEEAGAESSLWGRDFITQLRPFLTESDGLYIAIQLPMMEAMRSYFALRNGLLLLTGVAPRWR